MSLSGSPPRGRASAGCWRPFTVPALAGLVVVAPDFVPIVLGDHWSAVIPVVQILAWVGIVQALQSLQVDILMARGRGRTIFRFSIVMCAAHVAGVRDRRQVGRRRRGRELRDLDHARRVAT